MSMKYELYLKNSSTVVGIDFDGTPKELVKKFTSEEGYIEFLSNYPDHPIFILGEQVAGFSSFPEYKDGEPIKVEIGCLDNLRKRFT